MDHPTSLVFAELSNHSPLVTLISSSIIKIQQDLSLSGVRLKMYYSKQFFQASTAEYNQLLYSEMKVNCGLRSYGLVLFWKNWPA